MTGPRARLPLLPILLLLSSCGTTSSPPAVGPDGAETEAAASAGERTVDLARRLELTRPGRELRRLAPVIGSWQVRLETLDEEGLAVRRLAEGSAEITSELGGRYLRWQTSFLLEAHELQAEGLLGFDSEGDEYQFLWLSELATGMRVAVGRGDPERGGIRLEMTEIDPESGAVVRVRTVLEIDDHDHFVLEQWGFDPAENDWVPLQRTSYSRAEPAGSSSAEEAPSER